MGNKRGKGGAAARSRLPPLSLSLDLCSNVFFFSKGRKVVCVGKKLVLSFCCRVCFLLRRGGRGRFCCVDLSLLSLASLSLSNLSLSLSRISLPPAAAAAAVAPQSKAAKKRKKKGKKRGEGKSHFFLDNVDLFSAMRFFFFSKKNWDRGGTCATINQAQGSYCYRGW